MRDQFKFTFGNQKNLQYSIRQIKNNKLFTAINLFGLAIGIAAFLVLFIYTNNEKSFDRHFSNAENIYRVTSMPMGIDNNRWARSLGMIHTAAANIPDVEKATWFSHSPVSTISINEKQFQQKDVMIVDENFIDLFEVEALVGDLHDITAPNTAFISERFAQKYFKGENPVGKTIDIVALQYDRDLGPYEIRGIVKNTHLKTHFNYEVILSQNGVLSDQFASLPDSKTQWVYNYLQLKKGANPTEVAQNIHAQFLSGSLTSTRGPKDYQFALTPLLSIHLNSSDQYELKDDYAKINIRFFVVISLVILLISLFNFTNLSLAKLLKRSEEFKLRRSIGATKAQLISQIITEIAVISILAAGFALTLIELTKPLINQLFNIQFAIFYNEPILYISLLLIITSSTFLATLFALFFLNHPTATPNRSTTMRPLLVAQVAIVIILMASTILVNKQIRFILNSPLGYDKEQVVVLQIKDSSKDPALFANRLKQESGVESVGFTMQHFGYPTQGYQLQGFGLEGTAAFVFANYNYLETMKIPFIKNWVNTSSDTIRGMVINKHLYNRLMERHGSMEALMAYQSKQTLEEGERAVNFIGVVDDFNYSSAHEAIGDYAFWIDESNNRARFTHIRLSPGNLHQQMERIRAIWDVYYPEEAFDYFFMDDKVASQYKAETLLSRILTTFSILGIVIAIIGISALSLFVSQQRTKEIGIRKVNGAKISEVMVMLNKDFVKWVAVAFLIATPVAYYAMQKWLENFAYKTELSWWIFALAGLLALGVALLTVSLQSWKAAIKNPIESLRYE